MTSKPQLDPQQSISSPEPVNNAPESTEQSSNSIDQNKQLEYLQERITQLEQTIAERENEIDSFKRQITELLQENSDLKMQLETHTEDMAGDPEHVFREAAQQVYQTLLAQQGVVSGETLRDPRQICERIETDIQRFEEQYDGQMNYTLSLVKEYLSKIRELIKFELIRIISIGKPT